MVTKLAIHNYRSFKQVGIDNLAKFNVFLGKNGVGKTSILEAFSIVGAGGSPGAILHTCRRRDLPPPSPQSDVALRSIFRDWSYTQNVRFSFVSGKEEGEVTIRPNLDFSSAEGVMETNAIANEGLDEALIVGLKTTFRMGSNKPVETVSQVSRDASRPSGTLEMAHKPNPVPRGLGAFTIQARQATSAGETAATLGRLFQKGKEDQFLDFMRIIRPDIMSINSAVYSGQTVISIKTKSGTRLLNEMGDGFCRLALLATGVLGGRCKLIIIDEVDSGLHRSIMPSVWDGLKKLAQFQPFQLISSTHNEDMLETALGAFEATPDDLAVFRLEVDQSGGQRVVRYSWEELNYSIRAGVDPRG